MTSDKVTKTFGSNVISISFNNDSDVISMNDSDERGYLLYDEEKDEIIRNPATIFWADFKIEVNSEEIKFTAQYDCGDNWCFYSDVGYSTSQFYEDYIKEFINESSTHEQAIIDFLDEQLDSSEPNLSLSNTEVAEFIRDNFDAEDSSNRFFSVVDEIHDICHEKDKNWALILAFSCYNKIESYGDFEISLQIRHELSKAQTTKLCALL